MQRPSFKRANSPERIALDAERERNRLASIAAIEAARVARGVPELDDIHSAQHAGRRTLAKWRSFTRRKDKLLELCGYEFLTWEGIDEVHAIIARTEREAADLAETVRRSRITGVHWPDAVVVVGIRLLTALDADRATKPNAKGWSKSTSPGGHWCTAMLDIDRDLAIKYGRTLLAKHLKQLRHIDPAHARKGA